MKLFGKMLLHVTVALLLTAWAIGSLMLMVFGLTFGHPWMVVVGPISCVVAMATILTIFHVAAYGWDRSR